MDSLDLEVKKLVENIFPLADVPSIEWIKRGIPLTLVSRRADKLFKLLNTVHLIAKTFEDKGFKLNWKKIFSLCLTYGVGDDTLDKINGKNFTLEERIVLLASCLVDFVQGLLYVERGFSSCEEKAVKSLRKSVTIARGEEDEEAMYIFLQIIDAFKNSFEKSRKWIL
ncbi:MAG: hypothetical protein DRJ47_07945 [Thermoprotei archaeon]|nr:MAG: hypothetical protein DRJ47_07945 [Thermoprotei archaeon]